MQINQSILSSILQINQSKFHIEIYEPRPISSQDPYQHLNHINNQDSYQCTLGGCVGYVRVMPILVFLIYSILGSLVGHVRTMPTLVFLISSILGRCMGHVRAMPTLIFLISSILDGHVDMYVLYTY